jgi:putative phosphoesterase
VKSLHPGLLPALENAHLDHILHAGDVSTWRVIERLREIAPVDVARGNRDFTLPREIGLVKHIELAGVHLALMHGHGGWIKYFIDKFYYLSQGYRLERYLPLLIREAKDARVVVYGHTHHRVNTRINGLLLFNPGSASFGSKRYKNPSWGILTAYQDGRVEGKILELKGYHAVKGEWISNQLPTQP